MKLNKMTTISAAALLFASIGTASANVVWTNGEADFDMQAVKSTKTRAEVMAELQQAQRAGWVFDEYAIGTQTAVSGQPASREAVRAQAGAAGMEERYFDHSAHFGHEANSMR